MQRAAGGASLALQAARGSQSVQVPSSGAAGN